MNHAETSVESGQEFLGCRYELMEEHQAELPYDITFTVIKNTSLEGQAETKIILNAKSSLYSDDVVRLLAHGYEDMLRDFAIQPEERIGDEWRFREPALSKAVDVGRGEIPFPILRTSEAGRLATSDSSF